MSFSFHMKFGLEFQITHEKCDASIFTKCKSLLLFIHIFGVVVPGDNINPLHNSCSINICLSKWILINKCVRVWKMRQTDRNKLEWSNGSMSNAPLIYLYGIFGAVDEQAVQSCHDCHFNRPKSHLPIV